MKDKTILVAEDEPYIRTAYQIGLESTGYEVLLAENGVEAIEQATKNAPDLILLDLLMPKKNGFEVLVSLKSNPKTRGIPIIVITNLSQTNDEREVKRLGASEFIVKSDHSLKELLAVIKKWLVKQEKEHL